MKTPGLRDRPGGGNPYVLGRCDLHLYVRTPQRSAERAEGHVACDSSNRRDTFSMKERGGGPSTAGPNLQAFLYV